MVAQAVRESEVRMVKEQASANLKELHTAREKLEQAEAKLEHAESKCEATERRWEEVRLRLKP